jgi:hypothetical protein
MMLAITWKLRANESAVSTVLPLSRGFLFYDSVTMQPVQKLTDHTMYYSTIYSRLCSIILNFSTVLQIEKFSDSVLDL